MGSYSYRLYSVILSSSFTVRGDITIFLYKSQALFIIFLKKQQKRYIKKIFYHSKQQLYTAIYTRNGMCP